mgnify:CR=1 FL=1
MSTKRAARNQGGGSAKIMRKDTTFEDHSRFSLWYNDCTYEQFYAEWCVGREVGEGMNGQVRQLDFNVGGNAISIAAKVLHGKLVRFETGRPAGLHFTDAKTSSSGLTIQNVEGQASYNLNAGDVVTTINGTSVLGMNTKTAIACIPKDGPAYMITIVDRKDYTTLNLSLIHI